MPLLAETQSHLRLAIVAHDAARIVPLLVGGRDPQKRLAIHQRNYETSLVNALLGKFPATHWLVGTSFLAESRARVHSSSPTQRAMHCRIWRGLSGISCDTLARRPRTVYAVVR